jgi:phytoene dehydrogenase-like protein
METYDAVVIGSGIGGLVGAGILTSAGLKTLALERHVAPGGYLSSFKRNGFVFDSTLDCISGVAPGGIIYRVLELLGVGAELRFIRLDPVRVNLFPDFEIAVDADIGAYKERLGRLFPSETAAIGAFFDKAQSVYINSQSALNSAIGGELRPTAVDHDLIRLMRISYGEMLDEYFTDFRLKAALSDRCCFIGLPPSEVSALAMINMILSYFTQGAYRPVGGFQRLADALADGILKRGGRVVFGSGVRRIVLDDNDCCKEVVCDDGRRYGARYVVSNADYCQTFKTLLGGKHGQTADEMTANPGISTSFFIVYAGIRGELDMHSSRGYYPSYDMEGLFNNIDMELPEDSIIGITAASIEDGSRAPRGCHTVVFHELVKASGRSFDKAIRTERIFQKTRGIFRGIENGIRDSIVALDAATPSTLHRYTGNINGAAFGWRQVRGFRGPGRHGIKNLYIAGHWGDIGGGVLGAAYSGARAAGEILAKEGIKGII